MSILPGPPSVGVGLGTSVCGVVSDSGIGQRIVGRSWLLGRHSCSAHHIDDATRKEDKRVVLSTLTRHPSSIEEKLRAVDLHLLVSLLNSPKENGNELT